VVAQYGHQRSAACRRSSQSSHFPFGSRKTSAFGCAADLETAGAKVAFTQADVGAEAARLDFVNARRALSNWERPQAARRKKPDTGLGRRFETNATA
jgi:hypothetical protein